MNRKIAFALALVPLLAQAQVYRWVDEQGKVHYSQTPPAKSPESAQIVPQAPGVGAPSAGGAAPATPKEKNKALEKVARDLEKYNKKADEARAKSEEQAAKRDAACKDAKADMHVRDDFGGRTFSMDENGNRQYWSKEKQAEERARIQRQMEENC